MNVEVHSRPRLNAVIREHIKATADSLRTIAIVPLALLVLATFLAIADFVRGRGGVEFTPELSMIPAFAGLLLPVAIWTRENVFHGGHLWTLPVDRSRNAFAKLVAGWVVLMITVAAFTLWLLIIALITKGNITGDEVIRLIPQQLRSDPDGQLTLSMLKTVTWIPNPIYWLVPFSAATGTYSIATAFMLGLKYPFRLLAGVVVGVLLLTAVGQSIDDGELWKGFTPMIEGLMYGRYGLDALLTARTESLHSVVRLANGEQVVAWRGLPLVSDWLKATLLWSSLGVAGVIAALFRHREMR
jgi:hypothetical protein